MSDRSAPFPSFRTEADVMRLGQKLIKVYVDRPVDVTMRAAVSEMVIAHALGPEARAIALFGASGAGKSTMLEKHLGDHPAFGGDGIAPRRLISLKVPAPATLAALGQEICIAAGYPVRSPKPAMIWAHARRQLRAAGIDFVHLDEVQTAFETANSIEASKIRDTLKTLLNDPNHRVGLILSGVPSIHAYVLADEEGHLARRTSFVHLGPAGPESVEMVAETVRAMARAAGMEVECDLAAHLIPRLLHAVQRQFGHAIEAARWAIYQAYAPGIFGQPTAPQSTVLTTAHFAAMYARRATALRSENPFVAVDWAGLDCRGRLFEAKRETKASPSRTRKGAVS